MALDGYEIFHNLDEEDNRGIALYVRHEMKPSPHDKFKTDFSEKVFAECQEGDSKLLVGLLYRSPNSSPENTEKLNELLKEMTDNKDQDMLIMGDFNFPQIDWNSETCEGKNENAPNKFMKATRDAYLIQHQKEPTRHREGEKANIVDLVFTNRDDMIEEINTTAGIGKSDHCTLVITLNFTIKEAPRVKRYNYQKTDTEKLKEDLGLVDWEKEMTNLTANDMWEKIKHRVKEAIKKSTPLTTTSGRKGKGWMDTETLETIRRKHKLFKEWKKNKNESSHRAYIKARNQSKAACRKAQQAQERKVASEAKTNPKVFWNHVRSKTKTKTGIADLRKQDGTKTKSDKEKADLLNQFFQSVFTKESNGPLPETPIYKFETPLENFEITEKEVKMQLENLKQNKAPGPDEIPPSILAKAADELTKPFTILFRKSLDSGKIPDDWKCGHVTPIFKKGSKATPSNYRPVSLTCIACKVMEKIVRDKVMAHLLNNNLISEEQHGFVPGRSTITQLLEVMDEWTDILDEGGKIDIIYMDYQKAFDSVPHRRLVAKAEAHGIGGNTLRWIQDFLTERTQKVIINGAQSKTADVTSGIPQGSVLGPILFIIFINDLPTHVKSSVRMFADDTKLFVRSDNPQGCEDLQEDLDNLQEWSNKWQLKFHPQKCAVMKIGKPKSEAEYSMTLKAEDGSTQGITLAETVVEKDLGVWIDDKLNFSAQVSHSVAKANRMVGLIRRSFDYLTTETFVQLYKSLVRPILEYGHCIWQPCQKTLCSDIEDVQRRATKLIGTLKDKPYPERLRLLKLPTLEHRRLRGDMIEVYKYLHGHYSVRRPKLTLASGKTLRGHSMKLQKDRHRLDIRGNYFSHRVVDTWNGLTEEVVTAPNVNIFKSRLDHLWRNLPTMYSPNCQS